MIRSYRFANFQSFHNWTEINLVMPKNTFPARLMTQMSDEDVISQALVLVGPNASGKTAVLKVPSFLIWFITSSFHAIPTSPIPVEGHYAFSEEPVEFELIFQINGTIWKYELVCTASRVIRESLYKKQQKYSYVFHRKWNPATESYSVRMQNFDFPAKQAKQVRPNASLISTAVQYNVDIANEIASGLATGFITNVNVIGKESWLNPKQLDVSADYFTANPNAHSFMKSLLKEWDLGLNEIEFKAFKNENQLQIDLPRWEIRSIHEYEGRKYALSFLAESDGTKGLFNLLAQIIPVLEEGGLAIVDELETDLHPHMLKKIVDLFASIETNPLNAQLIFSSHSVEILNSFNKHQIVLVEKDNKDESIAYTLGSLKGIRDTENYYSKYISGAYGAIPRF